MKNKARFLTVLIICALGQAGFGQAQQNQSLRDLLQGIQPGQGSPTAPAQPAQPAPAAVAAPTPAGSPAAAVPEFKPVFMSIVTNYHLVTNRVIVTNYVVVTNLTYTTNYYNAQGQLMTPLQPVQPQAPAAVQQPAAPDPAVVRSHQVRAIRELLALSTAAASNSVAAPGSFTANPNLQIRIPEGVTVFDRRKGQALTEAMNKAAENAAPGAFALVQKTVAQINPPEPAQVLQGGNDAATRFLLSNEGQKLTDQVLGLVQTSAANAHVSEAYNAVMLRGGGLLGAVLGTGPSVDMNAHITRGLVEAIFLNLASEENRIRTDPTAAKSRTLQDALKK